MQTKQPTSYTLDHGHSLQSMKQSKDAQSQRKAKDPCKKNCVAEKISKIVCQILIWRSAEGVPHKDSQTPFFSLRGLVPCCNDGAPQIYPLLEFQTLRFKGWATFQKGLVLERCQELSQCVV